MTLSELINTIYENSGLDLGRDAFFLALIDNAMHEPQTVAEKKLFSDDKYNPFTKLEKDTIDRYFKNGQINVKNIRTVYKRRDANRLAKFINSFGDSACFDLEESIKKHLPGFNSDEGDIGYAVADQFFYFIEIHISDKQEVQVAYSDPTERLSTAVALGQDFYVDMITNTLHIGQKVIQLPDKLMPSVIPKADEEIYIKALLAAYADDLGRDIILPEELATLDKKYRKNFSDQRISYYSALRICRILRESFIDADEELTLWKKDTAAYIAETLNDDYDSAYKRLVAVLKFVVDCTTTAAVDSCKRFIGANERKGVCHLLVNDGEFTWVDEDE